jgi:hypothetical protein
LSARGILPWLPMDGNLSRGCAEEHVGRTCCLLPYCFMVDGEGYVGYAWKSIQHVPVLESVHVCTGFRSAFI